MRRHEFAGSRARRGTAVVRKLSRVEASRLPLGLESLQITVGTGRRREIEAADTESDKRAAANDVADFALPRALKRWSQLHRLATLEPNFL